MDNKWELEYYFFLAEGIAHIKSGCNTKVPNRKENIRRLQPIMREGRELGARRAPMGTSSKNLGNKLFDFARMRIIR